MALQVSLTIPPNRLPESPDEVALPDVVYPEAYARILYIRVDTQTAYPLVAWYEDAAARERGDAPVKLFEYGTATASLTGDIYPAAYAWLKTLPEFSGATDC
jgi:hypothetical protein